MKYINSSLFLAVRVSGLIALCVWTNGYFARFALAEGMPMDFADAKEPAKDKPVPVMTGDANLLYIQGRQRVLDGRYEEALPFIEGAAKADPENPFINYQLGEVYLRTGNLEKAEEAVKKAVAKDGNNAEFRSTLGWIYASGKQFAQSKEQFKKVLELDPTNAKAPLLLGVVEVESGNPEEGIKVLSKVIEKNPDNLMAFFYRAKVYVEMDNLKQAREDLEKCIAIRPSFVEAGTTLGLLLEKQGEIEEAIKIYGKIQGDGRFKKRLAQLYLQKNDFEKALKELIEYEKIEPDDYTARLKVGLIYFELKQYPQAVERFQAILKEQPDADSVRFYLGAVYEDQRKFDSALYEFKKVTKDSTFFKEAMLHMGFIYKEQGKFKEGLEHAKKLSIQAPDIVEFYDMHASFFEAQKDYRKALGVVGQGLKKFPVDERLLYFEGALFDKLGERQKGVANMRKILTANPNNAHALNFLGYTLAELGEDLEEAETLVRKALALRPNDGYIEDSLGWILFKKGKIEEAVAALQKASQLQPEEAIIYEHLGDVYLKSNREKALEMYRKAIALSQTKDKDLSKKVEKKLAQLEGGKSEKEVAQPGVSGGTNNR